MASGNSIRELQEAKDRKLNKAREVISELTTASRVIVLI
jgi:hypothetical protein